MNIQPLNFIPNCCHPQQKRMYPNLAPLKADTVSFTAMKKVQFKDYDLMCVEKFKAPIEKFNTNDDLQKWAANKLEDITTKDFGGRQEETKIQRKAILKEWSDYITKEDDGYTPAMGLLIMSAISKDLKKDNDALPPTLNKGVLADTFTECKTGTNLSKVYETKLRELYLEDTNTGETGNKWITIPSYEHDSEHFKENVEKLKAISHKSWCTKSLRAEPYLNNGDFHIYLEDGKPKVGIRFIGNQIEEIQGEKNNEKIPVKYYDEINRHIKENNLNYNSFTESKLKEANKNYKKFVKIKTDLKPLIEENNTDEIYNYLGITTKSDNKGGIILSHYNQPNEDFTFEDLGINEKKIFEKVTGINGDGIFSNSTIKDISKLEFVKGKLDIKDSNIESLGNIKEVGYLDAYNSKLKDLGKLKRVRNAIRITNTEVDSLKELKEVGSLDASNTLITSLGKLEKVKQSLKINYTKVTSLEPLKSLGGSLEIEETDVKTLGDIEEINGYITISNSKIKSLGALKRVDEFFMADNVPLETLGNLEYVGGNADVPKNIKSLGNLKYVGKNLIVKSKKLKTLGNLERVDGFLSLKETKVTDLGKLNYVGEGVYIKGSKLKKQDFKNIKIKGRIEDRY